MGQKQEPISGWMVVAAIAGIMVMMAASAGVGALLWHLGY